MPLLPVSHVDSFSPTFKPKNPPEPNVAVTQEQMDRIKDVLAYACSDSRFAEKAYIAIEKILTMYDEES